MSKNLSEQILSEFSNLHGVSGFESEVRNEFVRHLKQLDLDYQIDKLGNVTGRVQKNGQLSVLIMAHMDEVGFLTQHVDEQGFIRAIPLGRWVDHILWDKEWLVHIENQSFVAYSGMDPPHISGLYKNQLIDINKLFFDTGLTKKEIIDKGFRPGLAITPATRFKTFANGEFYSGKAFDDRVGLALIIELLTLIKKEPSIANKLEIQFAATVQEELGRRGSRVIYSTLKPDIVINLEASIAQDYPEQFSNTHLIYLGKGPALFAFDGTMIPDQSLLNYIAAIAHANKIPFQWEVEDSYGEDASCLQKSGHGVPAVNIGIPMRYAHSHHSVMRKLDYQLTLKLLFLCLKGAFNFTK
ncbi:M42 family metallopeptidase [Legionella drozanskii]|uniref:Endo-1,4 beta-glucanase n=1 Tax=Legionella drozanskii LLAP-1 TaxID=1212489 RepID=A0A0W0SWU2_9GAMM|nr:M28 family peptidase [Legionella drozanskii]KTC87818.1 endo-1,4 beta-glucanase [Legionella drozanskii LLAP-1]